ncbi:conserved hypothetical protein [gamma proteobacterium HdN1]|nr:conserved hypothetical protein [gamma proteobacterium HdN1]
MPSANTVKKSAKPAANWLQRLSGQRPWRGRAPLTEKDYAKLWDGPKHAIPDYLPWVDFDDEKKVFLLNDGVSVGAVFELRQVNVEGKSSEFIGKVQQALKRALAGVPEVYEGNPWIVQIYLQDEPIESLVQEMQRYAKPAARESQHSKEWFNLLEEHVRQMSREQGIFEDELAGIRWRGLTRRVRLVLYRYTERGEWLTEDNTLKRSNRSPSRELNQAARVFTRALQGAGVAVKRLEGAAFFEWMGPFCSPNPVHAKDGYEWVRSVKRYPAPGKRTATYDFGQAVFAEEPRTDEDGRFWFCDQPTRFLSITPLETTPDVGVITAEIKNASGKEVSLWDELPRGSLFTMTIVIESQLHIKHHLEDIIQSGGRATREAEMATDQAQHALNYLAEGNRIYRVYPGVYLRGDTDAALEDAMLNTMTILSQAGLSVIPPKWDLAPIDAFLRALPMAYHYTYDRARLKRAWLCDADDLTALLPLYGRSTGTGNPGFFFFNRVGEPLLVDPFNKRDRTKTAHLLLFGPTGSGKSATANYLLQHIAAIHDPRLFIIEKGNSFGRLGKHFAGMGKTVNHIRFTPSLNISLPPYAETSRALEQLEFQEEMRKSREKMAANGEVDDAISFQVDAEAIDDGEDDEDDQRDFLGEMVNLTILMVTGASKREEEHLSQADRALLKECLIEGLLASARRGAPHALPQDVVDVMNERLKIPSTDEHQRLRLRDMSTALGKWTSGIHGHYFNRYGESWPEADCTIVDMGILTGNNNDDMLAVALISLINTITGLGEKYQHVQGARETIVLIDEGHVITKNPVLAKPLVFGLKTWRKLAIWLWQATQNLADYPDEAEVMLALAEWWICLTMESEQEIKQIARFKPLTEDERALLVSARKQDGAFTEGVILGSKIKALFRVVMPALPLVLSMTDVDQKKAIAELARKHGISEIAAAHMMAKKIIQAREQA